MCSEELFGWATGETHSVYVIMYPPEGSYGHHLISDPNDRVSDGSIISLLCWEFHLKFYAQSLGLELTALILR